MFKKRCIAIFLSLMIIVGCGCIPTSALSEEEMSSPSGVLLEASTGKVLFEKNAHEQRACASITKVMTLLLVMEAID